MVFIEVNLKVIYKLSSVHALSLPELCTAPLILAPCCWSCVQPQLIPVLCHWVARCLSHPHPLPLELHAAPLPPLTLTLHHQGHTLPPHSSPPPRSCHLESSTQAVPPLPGLGLDHSLIGAHCLGRGRGECHDLDSLHTDLLFPLTFSSDCLHFPLVPVTCA